MAKFAVALGSVAIVATTVFAPDVVVAAGRGGSGWEDLPNPRQSTICDNQAVLGCPGRPAQVIGSPGPEGPGGGGNIVFCFFDGRCYIVRAPKI